MSRLKFVEIDAEPIELCKLLKFANMVSSGGEAKVVITGKMVLLNGKVEMRKRKKVFWGDIVEFNNEKIKLKKQESKI